MIFAPENLLIGLIALIIERLTGYPDFLLKRIHHPVVWIGTFITALDTKLNHTGQDAVTGKLLGLFTIATVILVTLIVTVPVMMLLRSFTAGGLIEALLAGTLISQSSLKKHVADVAGELEQSLEKGRDALRHIVGRDPQDLPESEVAGGAIESLAENTSDGIVAPLLWLIVGGLPGIAVYKAINTADSMIGYRSEKYENYGWVAARLDDLANLPASRLTGLLFAVSARLRYRKDFTDVLRTMWRDAPKHVSPNAGWPEAAMAGALDIRLGGSRTYQGKTVQLNPMGAGRSNLSASDIYAALDLYRTTLNGLIATLALVSVAVFFVS